MTSTTWTADNSIDPPIYRKGIWRFQPHGLVLMATAYVWASLIVRAASPFPLQVDYTSFAGASFLFVAVFALLLSLVEIGQWARALLPRGKGFKAFSVGLIETLCATGLALHFCL